MCNLGDVMSAALPASFKLASESKVIMHADIDGDMDLVINNNNGPPNLLIREGTPEKNWVAIQIKGRQSNWDGYGAKIPIYSESGTQSSYVNPGAS